MFALAGKPLPLAETQTAQPIPAAVQTVLDGFAATPAFAIEQFMNVAAWNRAAQLVFGEFLAARNANKNWARFVFAPQSRRFFANWQTFAECTAAVLRRDYGCFLGVDERGEKLLRELHANSPDFAAIWREQAVLDKPHTQKEFEHPQAGRLRFDSITLLIEEACNLRIVVYVPAAATDTKAKFDKLLKR